LQQAPVVDWSARLVDWLAPLWVAQGDLLEKVKFLLEPNPHQ
jgi:hypothetical protein